MSHLMLPDDHTSRIQISEFLFPLGREWWNYSHLQLRLFAFNLKISSTFGKVTYFFFLVWFINLMSLFRCCLMIPLVAFKSQILFNFDRESFFGWSFDILVWCLFSCCLMITLVAFKSQNFLHFWQRILFWLKYFFLVWFLNLMSLFRCCLMITLVTF